MDEIELAGTVAEIEESFKNLRDWLATIENKIDPEIQDYITTNFWDLFTY